MNITNQLIKLSVATTLIAYIFTSANAEQIEEVIVTATKLDRTIDQAPGFIQLQNPEQLKQQTIHSIDELGNVVPGLSFNQRGNRAYDNVTLRGQSSFDFYEPKVQVLVDGIPEDQALLSRLIPTNIESIETLYGPQGSILGRGSIGGAINIVTKKPSNQRSIGINAELSNLGDRFAASASGALVKDSLYADIYGNFVDTDGEYIQLGTDKELGERDESDMTARLRYAPANSPINLLFAVSRLEIDSTEEQYVPAMLVAQRKTPPIQNDLSLEATRYSLTGSYQLDGSKITSISSYQDRDFDRVVFNTAIPEQQKTFSQELRWSTTDNQNFNYVVGAYYEKTDFESQRPSFGLKSVQDLKSSAVFGELVWSLNQVTDITLGARYDRHKAKATGSAPSIALSGDKSFSATTPKVAISFALSESIRTYALYSTGFKSGGFTRLVTPPTASFSYQPELVDNLEIGIKGKWLDNKLSLTVAAYKMKNDDFQMFVGTQPFQYLQNVGKAESKGVDIALSAKPTEQLSFNLALSTNNAKFTEYANPLAPGVNFVGNKLPYAPKRKLNASVAYLLDVGSLGKLTPSIHMVRTSEVFFDETNTVGQDGYSLYNANIDWQTPYNFTVSAFATNLGDKIYRTYGFNGGPTLGTLFQIGRGKTVGIKLSKQF